MHRSDTKDIKKVEQYFTRTAANFDSLYSENELNPLMRFVNRKFRHDIYERFILSLEHLRRYELCTVLDVGCGSGRYACALGQVGVKRVVGVDLSPKMIELAIENVKNANLIQIIQKPDANRTGDKTFEFICCDFMEFQTSETFDVVLAMGFFDYIKDPLPVLQKMKALAKHSVIASFPSISLYRTPIRKIRYYFKRCPVYFYDRDKIISFSLKAGFSNNSIVKIKGSGMDYFVAFFK